MCVYVYSCMYVYILMHVCMYVCIHVCIYVHVCMYSSMNTYIHVQIQLEYLCFFFRHPSNAQIVVSTYIHTHARTHTHAHTLIVVPLYEEWLYCNTLQHNATHCNTLQHTATHYNALQHAATRCKLQHISTIHVWGMSERYDTTHWNMCHNPLIW